MKKICLLAPANSIHTQKIAYSLKSYGYIVIVLTFHKANLPGVEVIYFPQIIPIIGKINYILNVFKIKKIINQLKPDILHAHYISSYGIIASLLNWHPFIVSVWGSDIFDFPKISIIHKRAIQYVLKKADIILSTSNIMAKETKKYTKKEIYVTPFGVDCNNFRPIPTLKPQNKIIIGTIKALKPKYGIEYLIKAFKILLEKYPNLPLELHIGGKGYLRAKLKELSKNLSIVNRIKFLGYIPHNEVPKYFNTFSVSVSVSVSESESFGVAVLEAEACGIPVIVSNIGGLPEVVQDGKTGFVVPPRNPEETARAIEKVLLNKKRYKKLSYNAREFVLKNYSWIRTFELITNIYNKKIKVK